MGARKSPAKKRAAKQLAATQLAAAAAGQPVFRRHFFHPHQPLPTITSRLHRAIYNGHTRKTEFLTSIHKNPFQLLDSTTISALFLALARDQPAIAGHLLHLLQLPLLGLQLHFEDRPQPHRPPHFWLHQPLLVAYGRDQIDFARQQSHGMLVAAGELVPATEPGLLIVCMYQPNGFGEVLWLRPRTREQGRRLARIVRRIYANGGDISLNRREWRGMTVLDVAAEMALADSWWLMWEMWGSRVLTTEQTVALLWQLAANVAARNEEESSTGLPLFREWLSRAQIDVAAEFRQHSAAWAEELLLAGASCSDFALLEWMLQQAIANCQQPAETPLFRQHLASRLVHHSLFRKRPAFTWQLLQWRPDLCADAAGFEHSTLRWLVAAGPWDPRPAEHIREHELAAARQRGWLPALLWHLVHENWLPSVADAVAEAGGELRWSAEGEQTLCQCLDRRHDEMVAFVLARWTDEPADLRLRLLEHVLRRRELGDLAAELRQALFGRQLVASGAAIGRLVCGALRCGRVASFREMCAYADGIQLALGDIRDRYSGDNLLALTIRLKELKELEEAEEAAAAADASDQPDALELSDSDDDEPERQRKHECNRQRRFRPAQPDEAGRAALVEESDELFAELLSSGAFDVHHRNAAGENLLHIAVDADNLRAIRRLVANDGPDVGQLTASGNSCMHLVRSPSVFRLLPATQVMALNERRQTALLRYLQQVPGVDGDVELVRLMLAAGGKQLAVASDAVGQTALHLTHSPAIVRLLVEAGAAVNAVNAAGDTPVTAYDANWSVVGLRELLQQPDVDLLHVNARGESMLKRLWQRSDQDVDGLLDAFSLPHVQRQLPQLFRQFGPQDVDVRRAIEYPVMYNEYCRLRCGQITSRGFWRPEMVRGRLGQLALESYGLEEDGVPMVAALIVAGANYWRPVMGGEGDGNADEAAAAAAEWSSPVVGTIFECLLAIEGEEDDEEEGEIDEPWELRTAKSGGLESALGST